MNTNSHCYFPIEQPVPINQSVHFCSIICRFVQIARSGIYKEVVVIILLNEEMEENKNLFGRNDDNAHQCLSALLLKN